MTTAEPLAKGHNAPCSNRDYDFFYTGLEEGKLLVQRCASCGTLRNPPSPACPDCQSLAWQATPMSGRGSVFSYVVHYHPPLPGFDNPHPVVLVELEEGIRFVGAIAGIAVEDIRIGMPVAIEFQRRGDIATFRFRPA